MSGDFSMLDLFRAEVTTQTGRMSEQLLKLEARPGDAAALEALMRAAHSIKGAGRMVDVEPAVRIAHVIEDIFVAAQQGRIALQPALVDALLAAVDLLNRIAAEADQPDWAAHHGEELDTLVATLNAARDTPAQPAAAPVAGTTAAAPVPAPRTDSGPTARQADPAMLDLFRIEVEAQTRVLSEGLLDVEQDPSDAGRLEAMMRAAHSIKGAARMVGVIAGVRIAHVMEDGLVAAQQGKLVLGTAHVDLLLRGVDMLTRIGAAVDIDAWTTAHADEIDALEAALATLPSGAEPPVLAAPAPAAATTADTPASPRAAADSAIRVSADSLNRLMGLAGEVQVEARWLRPYADALVQFKHRHTELISLLDKLRDALETSHIDEYVRNLLGDAQHKAAHCRQLLGERLNELDEYDRRSHNLASRLNREVIASRMRPFADGIHGFQRMVRDLARSLGKKVQLDIRGLATRVDRDILEKIEAPLNHLVRNALDHGIETPAERAAAGKPEQATIRLEALHSAGMLSIVVEDDGRGMDIDRLRRRSWTKTGLAGDGRGTQRGRADGLPVPARLLHPRAGHRDLRPRRRPRRGAQCGSGDARHRACQRASRQGHALPSAAAADAVGDALAAGRDRRRTLRLPAGADPPHAEAAAPCHRDHGRPPVFHARQSAHRPGRRQSGAGPGGRARPRATRCASSSWANAWTVTVW
jgi:two-component system, chemotaxis family, sensor histidine kinase and response regulator WspE